MNNRQRQLLVVLLASIGLGLLGGLAYNVTLNMLKPEKIEFDQASPDQQRKPQFNRPQVPSPIKPPSASECVVPPGGGPPVTADFKPC